MILLFPSAYDNVNEVDDEYKVERMVADSLGIKSYLFNYDLFIYEGKPFRVNINRRDITEEDKGDIVVYRGWMLKAEQYQKMYSSLNKLGLKLINTRDEYRTAHEFYYAYEVLKKDTPAVASYKLDEPINWRAVKSMFNKFIIKDYVKSAKGFDFPAYFDNTYSSVELDYYLNRFKDLRGNLLTGGILIKDCVDLKTDNSGHTNEYRCWFCKGKLFFKYGYSKYEKFNAPDIGWLNRLPKLKSKFYTLDVAELQTGKWVVIETGDGQVSGLLGSDKAYNFDFVQSYYEGLGKVLNK